MFSDSDSSKSSKSDSVNSYFSSDDEADPEVYRAAWRKAKEMNASASKPAPEPVPTPPFEPTVEPTPVDVTPSPVVSRSVSYNPAVDNLPENEEESASVKNAVRMAMREKKSAGGAGVPRGKGPAVRELRERRIAKRAKEQARWEEEGKPALALIPQTVLDKVRTWLASGYFKLQLVDNMAPGWLLVVPEGVGRLVTEDQIAAHDELRAKAAESGFPFAVPALPPWRLVGMLRYPPARAALEACGFELYLNFFGEPDTPQMAVEVPVAKKLEIYREGWVVREPYQDVDYARGGIGPFLAEPVYANNFLRADEPTDVDARRFAPGAVVTDPLDPLDQTSILTRGVDDMDDYLQIDPDQEARRKKREAYLEERMTKDFDGQTAVDLDKFAKLKKPTLEERGAGALPPSKGGGNPGRDPAAEDIERREPGKVPDREDDLRSFKDVLGQTVRYASLAERPEPMEYHPLRNYYRRYTSLSSLQEAIREALNSRGYDTLDPEWSTAVANMSIDELAPFVKLLVPDVQNEEEFSHEYIIRTTPFLRDLENGDLDPASVVLRRIFQTKAPLLPTENAGFFASPDTVFIQSSPDDASSERVSPSPDYNPATRYGVSADSPLYGLFSPERLQWLYQHLVLGGDVLFSVELQGSRGDALRFIPKRYACGHAWWWHSKVLYPPSSLYFNTVGAGTDTIARHLETASLTKDAEDIDPFTFLPPMRTCYGQSYRSANLDKLYAASKQNGLIYRRSRPHQKEMHLQSIQRPLRELVLSGIAASHGFGPRVFAAWVVPAGVDVPELRMNSGDTNAVFSDPMYEATVAQDLAAYERYQKPAKPWFKAGGNVSWNGSAAETEAKEYATLPESLAEYETQTAYSPEPSPPYEGGWTSMNVLMEGFMGALVNLTLENDQQVRALAEELVRVFERMSAASFLHCQLTSLSVVYRTWRDDNTPVTTTSPWNAIEVRVVNFDPVFCKVVPWLDGNVVFVINMLMFLAYERVHETKDRAFGAVIRAVMPTLKERFEQMNSEFPGTEGLVAAFRALRPGIDEQVGPPTMPKESGNGMAENFRVKENLGEYMLNNDSFEAARAFARFASFWIAHEMREYASEPDPSSPILARLLALVRGVSFESAKVANGPFTTAFDFEAYLADSRERMAWANFTTSAAPSAPPSSTSAAETADAAEIPSLAVDGASAPQTSASPEISGVVLPAEEQLLADEDATRAAAATPPAVCASAYALQQAETLSPLA